MLTLRSVDDRVSEQIPNTAATRFPIGPASHAASGLRAARSAGSLGASRAGSIAPGADGACERGRRACARDPPEGHSGRRLASPRSATRCAAFRPFRARLRQCNGSPRENAREAGTRSSLEWLHGRKSRATQQTGNAIPTRETENQQTEHLWLDCVPSPGIIYAWHRPPRRLAAPRLTW
jgi:hypothetical protein